VTQPASQPTDAQLTNATGSSPKPDDDELDDGGTMTFWEHLDELRKRLSRSVLAFLVMCVVAWEVRETILSMLTTPFQESWVALQVPGKPSLHFGAPGAAFMAYLELSLLGGIVFATPVIFYQLWAFVAPGLYAREKRFVIPFVAASTALFVGGGYFGWKAAFPITFHYFLGLSGELAGGGITIVPTVMMGDYIDFCVRMLLAFGIIFELPLLLLFLSLAGIVNYLQLIRFARWFVLLAVILGAVLSPGDAISLQLLMTLPLCALYALSIGLAYVFGKPPTESQREAYRRADEEARKRRAEGRA
jgi:sec-independent protein translocase protein TatC